MSERSVRRGSPSRVSPVGEILKPWRAARGMSQMDLGFAASVSARHLSFIETGRSNPSRSVLLRLADVLRMPLRDRNLLLEAAGYARVFRETDLDDPELAPARRVLEFLLARHEPFSAVVVDRTWNVLLANRPHRVFLERFLADPIGTNPRVEGNLLRLLFHPRGIRPSVANWTEVAGSLIARLRREATSRPEDPALALLEELRDYPGVPDEWLEPDPLEPLELLLPIHLESPDLTLRLVGTITVFGTPQDVTLEEMRLETFFPADLETDATIQELWTEFVKP